MLTISLAKTIPIGRIGSTKTFLSLREKICYIELRTRGRNLSVKSMRQTDMYTDGLSPLVVLHSIAFVKVSLRLPQQVQ